jgi:uncharacterized protein YutE (UPF0331/DUF86 family)
MVDKTLLASKVASVGDAVSRIRAVLPSDVEAFLSDRTTREVVMLNLFVAIQDCMSLAAHWLADEGLEVPHTYAEMFRRLGERGVIPGDLSMRLAAASGLRNLVAHQYGMLDWRRVFTLASERLDDLLAFCTQLADRAR